MGGKKRAKAQVSQGLMASTAPSVEQQKEQEASDLNEIDLIFSQKKRKLPASEEDAAGSNESKAGSTKEKQKLKKMKKGKSEKGLVAPAPQGGRKKSEDGYSIYSEAELGWNKDSGGTKLCPFDCDCCF